jgi:hypothetical protein
MKCAKERKQKKKRKNGRSTGPRQESDIENEKKS